MIKRNIVLFLITSIVTNSLYSQINLDFRTQQKINLEVLELIEFYTANLNLSKDEFGHKKMRFESCFADSATIFNDFMSNKDFGKQISYKRYAKLYKRTYFRNNIESNVVPRSISNIKMINQKEGYIDVVVRKTIKGRNRKGVLYIDTFDLVFSTNINISNIKKIGTSLTSIKPLNSYGSYCQLLLKKKIPFSKKETEILNNIELYVYNNASIESKRKLIKDDSTNLYFIKRVYLDSSLYLILKSDQYILNNNNVASLFKEPPPNDAIDENIRVLHVRQSIFTIEPHIGYSFFSKASLKINSDVGKINPIRNSSYSLGVDFGFRLFFNKDSKIHFFLKTGLSYSYFDFLILMNEYSYHYNDIDPDDYLYLRTNSFSNINENFIIKSIQVPIYLTLNIKLAKNYMAFIDMGGGILLNMDAMSNISTQALYSGYYQDLYGIDIAENGVYDFGLYNLSNTNMLNFSRTSYYVRSGIAIGRRLNNRTTIALGAKYIVGLSPLFIDDKKGFSANYLELNSITNLTNEFFINDININLKLIYNL